MATPTFMPEDQYLQVMQEISKLHQRMTDKNLKDDEFQSEIREIIKCKLDPVYDIFSQGKGFAAFVVFIVKVLLGLAMLTGVIAGFIKWLKD